MFEEELQNELTFVELGSTDIRNDVWFLEKPTKLDFFEYNHREKNERQCSFQVQCHGF